MIPFLVLTITLLGILTAAHLGMKNARGVFVIYFLSAVTLPYCVYLSTGEIPSFLSKFVSHQDVDYSATLLAIGFTISIATSVSLLTKQKDYQPALSPKAFAITALSYLSIAFFMLYIVISIAFAGSIEAALFAAYSRVRTNSSLANFRAVFFWGCIVLATYSFYCSKISDLSLKSKILIYTNIILAAILSLMDGGRAVFILFILSLFAKFILTAKAVKIAVFSLVSAVLISVASFTMIEMRYQTQGAQISKNGDIPLSESINGLAYIDHMIISVKFADDNGYDLGYSYINALISYIPRDIFPWKATPLAARVRLYIYGDDTGGIPPGWFGESYIFLGPFGVLIMSLVLGRLLYLNARTCNIAATTKCPTKLAAAGVLTPLIGFTLIRGGVDIGVIRVGIPLIWCIVATRIIKRYS